MEVRAVPETVERISDKLDPWTARLLLLVAVAMCLGFASQTTRADPDMFHELSLAREILDQGTVPWGDLFAFTETRSPTVHHEWGFGIVLLCALKAFGEAGIMALRFALLVGLVVGGVRLARRRGAAIVTLGVLALPSIFMTHYVDFGTLRAQTASLLLALLTLALIEQDRRGGRKWIAVWIPTLLVWQNLHGGFVVGVGLLGLHTLEQVIRREPARHLMGVLLVSAAMLPVHPWGIDYPRYLARALTMDRPEITEWSSMANASRTIIVCFGLTLLASVAAMIGRHRTTGVRNTTGFLLFVAVSILALRHQRHVSLYTLVVFTQVTPWFTGASWVARLNQLFVKRAFWVRYVSVIVVCAFLALFIEGAPHRVLVPGNPDDRGRTRYPVGAIDFLQQRAFDGRMMTPFSAGAYVSWRMYPEVKVSLDGRYEVAYEDGVLERNLTFYRAQEGWQDVLRQLAPDIVLLRKKAPIEDQIGDAEGWRLVYEDDLYELHAADHVDIEATDARGNRFATDFPDRLTRGS